jgi:hypothetical protein
LSGEDLPDHEALDASEPAPAAATTAKDSEDWSVLVKVALFGIVVAVLAIWWRVSRSQVGYQKIAA